MDAIEFDWDPDKQQENIRKHDIDFEEAKSVFYDENAVMIDDPDHSDDEEDRFIMMGISNRFRFLIVCHCYRDDDDTIRIISARKATKREVSQLRRQP